MVAVNGKDTHIGIVGFKDTTNGKPSQVILPFTDQDDFGDRKSATVAAIASMMLQASMVFPFANNES